MKHFLSIIAFSFLISCSNQANFENLSEEQKNELAKQYHDISMNYNQPSEMHRTYKDSALMAQPKHVEYTQRYSYSYKKTGEHIRAMELLNKAVDMDVPNGKTNALEYKAWSMLYFYRDYESTIEDVDKINEMNSPHPYSICHGEPCLLLKAQALYQLKRFQEAIDCFEKLMNIEAEQGFEPKDNFFARFYIARAYTHLNRSDKAFETYESLLNDFPKFTEVHYYIGQLYIEQGKKEIAKKHFEEAKKLFSENYKVVQEPYIERFDEVHAYQVDEALESLK